METVEQRMTIPKADANLVQRIVARLSEPQRIAFMELYHGGNAKGRLNEVSAALMLFVVCGDLDDQQLAWHLAIPLPRAIQRRQILQDKGLVLGHLTH